MGRRADRRRQMKAALSTAALLAALSAVPAFAHAQARLDCAAEGHPQDRLSFDVDFDREAVAGAFPINWVWFTPGFVLFQYSTSINGHHHALQTYVLDRATGRLEACDFAGGEQQACVARKCEGQRTLPASRASRIMVMKDSNAAARTSHSAPVVP